MQTQKVQETYKVFFFRNETESCQRDLRSLDQKKHQQIEKEQSQDHKEKDPGPRLGYKNKQKH